jgi:hypothetical protein
VIKGPLWDHTTSSSRLRATTKVTREIEDAESEAHLRVTLESEGDAPGYGVIL